MFEKQGRDDKVDETSLNRVPIRLYLVLPQAIRLVLQNIKNMWEWTAASRLPGCGNPSENLYICEEERGSPTHGLPNSIRENNYVRPFLV